MCVYVCVCVLVGMCVCMCMVRWLINHTHAWLWGAEEKNISQLFFKWFVVLFRVQWFVAVLNRGVINNPPPTTKKKCFKDNFFTLKAHLFNYFFGRKNVKYICMVLTEILHPFLFDRFMIMSLISQNIVGLRGTARAPPPFLT